LFRDNTDGDFAGDIFEGREGNIFKKFLPGIAEANISLYYIIVVTIVDGAADKGVSNVGLNDAGKEFFERPGVSQETVDGACARAGKTGRGVRAGAHETSLEAGGLETYQAPTFHEIEDVTGAGAGDVSDFYEVIRIGNAGAESEAIGGPVTRKLERGRSGGGIASEIGKGASN